MTAAKLAREQGVIHPAIVKRQFFMAVLSIPLLTIIVPENGLVLLLVNLHITGWKWSFFTGWGTGAVFDLPV